MAENVGGTVPDKDMATFLQDGGLGEVRVDCAVDEAKCPVHRLPIKLITACKRCTYAAKTEKCFEVRINESGGNQGEVETEWELRFLGRRFGVIAGGDYFEIEHLMGEVTLRRQPIDQMEVRDKN
ncbi:MAG: hypothetical protein WCT01_02435 [Candidatus Shapirobacteria bacterium]